MNYFDIVNKAFSVIFLIMALLAAHVLFFMIVGIFKAKKYKKAEKQLSYGILVSARNEELVIADLIASIQQSDYPKDKLKIFVVAHNCTDKTAEVARKSGAIVYEYNNTSERTKGYALRYLTSQIDKDFGIESLDGYFIFDSDNTIEKDYFVKMNDAFVNYDGKCTITSYRNASNFNTNVISGLYGLYFAYGCITEFRGRTLLNCSTRVSGTGYVVPNKVLKNGWNYLTITEDWELSADRILESNKIYYCDEAVFNDEQPTTFKIMWRQRVRWSKGHLIVFNTRCKELVTYSHHLRTNIL